MRSFPRRIAGIDIGSNAIRMLAAEFSDRKTFRELLQLRLPVRLGHDVFVAGEITPSTLQAAIAGLQEFRRRFDDLAIDEYRAVATSAVRDSSNGAVLVQRARDEAGIEIEVISGQEEAGLVHLAVRHHVELGEQRWLLADLGGGSLEISIIDRERVHQTETYPLGSVRLLERLDGNPGSDELQRRMLEYLGPLRESRVLQADVAGLIATGGNIEALAAIAPASPLSVTALRRLADELASLTYAERIAKYKLRPDRADVIVPAAIVYEQLATLARVETFVVPATGVKEGVLWQQANS